MSVTFIADEWKCFLGFGYALFLAMAAYCFMQGTGKAQDARLREAQSRLVARGYNVGKIDGLSGCKTRDAVRAFQGEANRQFAWGQLALLERQYKELVVYFGGKRFHTRLGAEGLSVIASCPPLG